MMRLLVILICFPLLATAQWGSDNPPWEIECGKSNSLEEHIECSNKMTLIADSVMNHYYWQLLNSYSDSYESARRHLQNSPDSTTFKEYEKIVTNLRNSQKIFITYRHSQIKLIEATISRNKVAMPIMINHKYIKLTEDRIGELWSILLRKMEK